MVGRLADLKDEWRVLLMVGKKVLTTVSWMVGPLGTLKETLMAGLMAA